MPETKIDVTETALMVIDMQNYNVKDKTGIFSDVTKMVEANQVIDNITKVIKAARQIGIPVFYVRTIRRKDGTDTWKPLITDLVLEGLWPAAEKSAELFMEGTSGADFVDELRPAAEDYVIEKRRISSFYQTDLELLLRRRGINTIILTGVVTSGCVEAAGRDARDRDFNVIYIEDCCGDRTKEAHEFPFRNYFHRHGRVRTSEEVIAAILR